MSLNRFFEVYEVELERVAQANPSDYPWYGALPVKTVSERMKAAVARNSHNHSGPAFKATCKVLGIKHTRGAIAQFCKGDEPEANADLEDKLAWALSCE